MEVKKARRADLEKGKSRWLFMGLIVTLSFMFVSFEWTERNVTYAISDLVSDPDFFEELVPVTYNQDKPLPPPPPPAAVNPEELNIVDNNSTETETDIAASDPTDAPVIIPTPIEVPEEVVDENVEFVVVEEMPVFRNGNADLMRYLSENIKYPTVSAEQGVQGRVVVQFVVGVHGEDPESGSGEECGSVSGQGSNPRDQFHAKMEARQAKRKSSEGEIHCSCSLQTAKLRFN